jgi:hypothetical protein
MSNRRHLPRSLFSLHKQLDRQRAVQRSIRFAENLTRLLAAAEKESSPQRHQGTKIPKGWFAWFLIRDCSCLCCL